MNDSNRKGLAIPLVFVICMVIFLGAAVASTLRTSNRMTLSRVLAGQDLELLIQEALEEGHYLLAMSVKPERSGSAAASRILAGMYGRPKSGFFPSPTSPKDVAHDHDANRFLRESTSPVYFAPLTVASSLPRDGRVRLGPVSVRVLNRRLGRRIESPYRGTGAAPFGELARLGLPPGVAAMRVTWGVVEFACEAEAVRGSRTRVVRRGFRRKLFTVVDHTPEGDRDQSYAHVFAQPIAQVIERD